MKKTALFALAALTPMMLAGQAFAADEAVAADAPTSVEELVVTGDITYRNRTDSAAPVLSYDLEYFQKFEPLTVGDALKRVPSVAFLSDILESDGVRLRGLDPAYTQILINGEEMPGGGADSGAFGNGADRAFFVDRIPAELIERVEIVRSPSANRSGDAVAGAINIVMRDSYKFNGGYLRAGGLYFAGDEELKGTLGGVWGGDLAGGRLMAGFNIQGRHNPKEKISLRYDAPGEDLANSEVQSDVRDGTDYSFNADYSVPVGTGEFGLSGFYVYTDRQQIENSIEYDEGVQEDASITTTNYNPVDIEQTSWTLNGRLSQEMFGGTTKLKVGYATFDNKELELEEEIEWNAFATDAEVLEGERALTDIEQTQWSVKLEHERNLTEAVALEFGLQFNRQQRDNDVRVAEIEFDPDIDPRPLYEDYEIVAGGLNTITETRLDPYVMLSGDAGPVKWEAGLRYETTQVEVEDRDAGTKDETDYGVLLPSANLRWNLTAEDRIHASVARTIRRPSFGFLSPAVLEGELGDNDFVGNPNLDPETAWGIDLGYERQLPGRGIVGINAFYRDVTDLIEVFNTGVEGDDGPGSWVYSARNVGDGKVWGIEFDLSTPLTFVGMENTGVFLNYSWLDSDVDDDFGSRRFNSQSDYVFNVGFIQDLPSWGASFGVSYRKQGDAFSRVVSEEVNTSYDGDLEAFVEKRFGKSFVVRLTGSNLLDGEKKEVFDKFDTAEDQIDRDYDEYEIEAESAGPVFQLIARYAF
ncbi:MAG: TonB-dependent receptor [Pseudomonadota bacterium]